MSNIKGTEMPSMPNDYQSHEGISDSVFRCIAWAAGSPVPVIIVCSSLLLWTYNLYWVSGLTRSKIIVPLDFNNTEKAAWRPQDDKNTSEGSPDYVIFGTKPQMETRTVSWPSQTEMLEAQADTSRNNELIVVDNDKRDNTYNLNKPAVINPHESAAKQSQLPSNATKQKNSLRTNNDYDHAPVNISCKSRLPQCIIVGVMKAGTEAFSRFLMLHPNIVMQRSLPSTLFFTTNFDKGMDWYRRQMMCSYDHQITVEKAPQYFVSSIAMIRIKRLLPGAKIVIMVRNPIDRAISHYLQQKQDSSTDVGNRTFEEMVFTKNGTVNSSSVFIDRSTYFLYMEQWIETFSRENVLIIDGDEFKVNQILALKDTESFLNLEHFITKDQFHFNEDKGFYCLKTIKERMNCLGEGKGRPHPDLKPDDKIKLQNYFAPYNKKFFQLIRRTLNW